MDVIVPEAVGPDLKPVTRGLLAQESQIEGPVFLSEEHGLAAVAALRDVVRNAGKGQPRETSHRSILCPVTRPVNLENSIVSPDEALAFQGGDVVENPRPG